MSLSAVLIIILLSFAALLVFAGALRNEQKIGTKKVNKDLMDIYNCRL